MFQRIVQSNGSATDETRVRQFEERCGLALPYDYRRFLIATNGGRPEPDTFPIEGDPPGGHSSDVQFFFGLDTDLECYDLEKVRSHYGTSVPSAILFIATDSLGNKVALDLRPMSPQVMVAFWDFRHHWGTGRWRERDLYPVASCFDAFLSGLSP